MARTAGTVGGTQHPEYEFMMQGNGELQLTEIEQGTAWLHFPEELAGLVTIVRRADGVPVAEFAKQAGVAGSIALDPGGYLLRRRTEGRLYAVQAYLAHGARLDITRWGVADGEAAVIKGNTPAGSRRSLVPIGAVLDDLPLGDVFSGRRR
mgnify:CR=1 FL=1